MRVGATVTLACLVLMACGQQAAPTNIASSDTAEAMPLAPAAKASAPAPATAGSCTAEIGPSAAQALAEQCRQLSPATRPPCHPANGCADIRSEIQRSCALFDAADRPAACDQPAAPDPVGLIRLYYALLDGRNYRVAYRLWDDDGRASRQTPQAFEAGFARTLSTAVRTGQASAPEGAAGSVYVTVPVAVDAMRDDHSRQHFSGSYVVRRNNVGPDREWRLFSAKLRGG